MMLVHDNPSLYLFALQIAMWNWLIIFLFINKRDLVILKSLKVSELLITAASSFWEYRKVAVRRASFIGIE